MDIQLKHATLTDLDSLIEIGSSTFLETYKGLGKERPPGLDELYVKNTFNRETLAPLLTKKPNKTNPVFILAHCDGRLAGYAKLEFDRPPDSVPVRNSAHFSQCYILQPFQKKGIGRQFFNARKQIALEKGCEGLWLGVWDQNTKAIEYHKRMGFLPVGSIEWKFTHDQIEYVDNDLVMFQSISKS